MEKSHFPGYSKCSACTDLIPISDARSHVLKCRGRSSVVATKLCVFCQKQIPINELQDHIVKCDEQQSIPSNSPLLSKKKSTNSDKSIDDSTSHGRSRTDNQQTDQNDDAGYHTPPSETPPLTNETKFRTESTSSKKKATKVCALCSETVDEADYRDHIAYCSPDDSSSHNNQSSNNNTRDSSNTRSAKTSSSQIDKRIPTGSTSVTNKKTLICALCTQSIDQSSYAEHIQSCSNEETRPGNRRHMNNDTSNENRKSFEKVNSPTQSPQVVKKSSIGSTNLKKKKIKVCPLCEGEIEEEEYEDHIASCLTEQARSNSQHDRSNMTRDSDNRDTRNSSGYSAERERKSSAESTSSKKKATKVCALCSETVDEADYRDHIASCSSDDNSSHNNQSSNNNTRDSSNTRSTTTSSSQIDKRIPTGSTSVTKKQTVTCALCTQSIDQSSYAEHIRSCSSQRKRSGNRRHMNNDTSNENSSSFEKADSPAQSPQVVKKSSIGSTDLKKNKIKVCPLCEGEIDEEEYENHIASCSTEQTTSNSRRDRSNVTRNGDNRDTRNLSGYYVEKTAGKRCVLCLNLIDESKYSEHILNCLPESPRSSFFDNDSNKVVPSKYFFQTDKKGDTGSASSSRIKTTRDCIMCFNPIEESGYTDHVVACVAEKSGNEPSTTSKGKHVNCFRCNCSINKKNGSSREISCHSHHNYCLKCLHESMEEFARTRTVPVCHSSLCDYELSRHDISLIPLERRLSDRLLKLVKGEQRPQCPKCHFYINISENEDLDEHIQSCEELIPCEYCQLPYSFNKLEDHAIQCRHDKLSNNEKLIDFVLIRTRYPFTKEQIRFFIQQQNKNRRHSLDPLSIIDALAVFGPIFPFEMPTRVCDICMEACPYDDIYVFDCDDSHKLCYGCYYQSCQTKMEHGQILTCALCPNPLRDGELNQLRVPFEEIKKIREYQMRKTFDIYSSRTQGIIKCPNQTCPWVAEAEDPNERFRIVCPICQNEFCSLCNQQYHYRTRCQQLPQITQRWFFWCQTERNRYLTMRSEQDATYAAQLNNYNRQNNENETRNRDLRRRYDELMNDEQYKVQNCRLCTSCQRVVQRIEGCDTMICGQDAHGGNIQSGCGANFNWTQAQPYTASATAQSRETVIDLPRPENPVVHHNGVKCDQCKQDLNGIRFDCVHCPSLTYCEKCEQESTLIHSRENQVLGQQQHVFKLIMTPQDEATLL